MLTKVWSEREPGRWTECAESSYLMALLHGGFETFPLGAYTDAERDALDEAIGFDHPGGGNTFADVDAGSMRRYGVRLVNASGEWKPALRARLMQPGRALAIAGFLSAFSAGHRLRRWQPGFTGGHAICVVALGNGGILWLDPLAPDDHPGDKATVDDVLTFAWNPSNAREAVPGMFAQEDDVNPSTIQPWFFVRVLPGGTAYRTEDRSVVAEQTWPVDTAIDHVRCYGLPVGASVADADGTVTSLDARGRSNLVPIRVKARPSGEFQIWWLGADKIIAELGSPALLALVAEKNAALDRILNNRLPAVEAAVKQVRESVVWTREQA